MPKNQNTKPRVSKFLQKLWDAEDKHPVMAGNSRNFQWAGIARASMIEPKQKTKSS